MDKQIFYVLQKDGYQTKLYPNYANQTPPLASIVIFHGMAEHHERYKHIANFFNEKGFDVYLFDHRGHGKDTVIDKLGYIADYKGDELLISDSLRVLDYIHNHNRCDKLILIGHSMGSLIARNVIQTYHALDSVVLCGTTSPNTLLSTVGKTLALLNKKLKGPTSPSLFMDKLLFGGKNYKIHSIKSSFDWLTRDFKEVGTYIHDPYCGFLCTTSFYHDLINLALKAAKPTNIKKTPKNIPILLISGDKDPVSNNGKEVQKLYQTYKTFGYTNITCTLYPECRHELFNEQNRHQILTDTHTWLLKTLT